jgi:hypothetical protein
MTALLFNLVMEKCEQPGAQERDHIPDDQSGNEGRERRDVLNHVHIHVNGVVQKPLTHSGNQSDTSEAHDVHDRHPCGHDFEKMPSVDHFLPFNFCCNYFDCLSKAILAVIG